MTEKYAVYVVIVEDTEDNDLALAQVTAEFERVAGGCDWDWAEQLVENCRVAVQE